MGYDLTNSREYKVFLSKLNTDSRENLISLLSELTTDIMRLESKVSYLEMLQDDGKLDSEVTGVFDVNKKKNTLKWLIKVKKDQVVLVQQKIAVVKVAQKEKNINRSSVKHEEFLKRFFKLAKDKLKDETFRTLVTLANIDNLEESEL